MVFLFIELTIVLIISSIAYIESWQSMQASTDIYPSFGEKHVGNYFALSHQLKEAIHYQVDYSYKKTSLSKLTRDGSESDVNRSFMNCTKYLHYDTTISRIDNRFKSFVQHI